MKKLDFIINKSDILKEVEKFTAYTGVKNNPGKDGDFFDRVATIEEDNSLMEGFWRDACGEVADKLRDYVETAAIDSLRFTLSLNVSGAYDEAQTTPIGNELNSFIKEKLLAKWFLLTLPGKAAECEAAAGQHINGIMRKICHRKAPSRKKNN